MKSLVGMGLLVLVLFVQPSQAQQGFLLNEIQVSSHSTFTRVSIPVPKDTEYVVGELKDPPRIVLNLYPIKAILPRREVTVLDRFVQKICLIKDSEDVVKATVSLSTYEYNFDISFQKQPRALVIEIRSPEKDIITALLGMEAAEAEERRLSLDSWQQSPGEKEGVYRVVIDPGHGGKDPGAIGPSGVKEKDVTFAIAKRLSKILKQNLEVEVHLTRQEDEFIPLDRRTEIANQLRADLFISVHTNAAWDSQARGAETFYNSRYAYGEGAEEVAVRENAALGADELSFSAKNIIWDLIQNQYRQESKKLSQYVQKKIVQTCNISNRGVKSAPFYVLRGASMPAILVEVGFVSNAWEESKLKKAQYQKLLSLGVYKGIAEYIKSFNKKARKLNQ